MLIASYNFAQTGDVLLVVLRQDSPKQAFQKKDGIVRIYNQENNETLGYNFFNASKYIDLQEKNGQIRLSQKEVSLLNNWLDSAGFTKDLVLDEEPRFVVGYVKEMQKHPDSDHLHILQVAIDENKQLQIVCGAPNIAAGQTVVIAKVGAMMPNGALIWPGKLRGQDSFGMVCSARELGLSNAPKKRGILELPAAQYKIGEPFDFGQAACLLAAE